MIRRLDEEEDEYVPSRKVVMMISSDESEDGDYSPVRPDLPEEDLERVSEQPEPPEDDKDDVTSSDEESSNGKPESSSVSRAVPRGILSEPKTRFSSPPLTSLIRDSPEPKTRVSRPDPPESFSLLYKKTQERGDRLIQSVNERIAQQNKYMEQMTKFLQDSKEQAETQMATMQDNFLGQINRIIASQLS